MKPAFAVAALSLVLITAALAQEKPVELKDAPGRTTVENMCAGCHSLGYIRINAPFMNRQTWTAEVRKMVDTYGAPVPAEDADTIVNYLAANYGAPE